MDFFSIVVFLILYYIRPHEWMSWVTALKPVMVSMALAIFAMFNRENGFSAREVFKTPHDWLMLCYFLWVVFAAPNISEALGKSYNVFVFYVVTIQALSNIQRIHKFLAWWVGLIFVVALLAVLSEYGFDPMGSYDLTHGAMKDRLVLNTSLFNNPNALGHGVVPCLMMLYYVCYWKRPVFTKIIALPLLFLPLYCIFLTVSKGAFLAAFASLILAYSFGRPKSVQIAIVVLAITVGYGALYSLPRMNELKKANSDPAIMGRVAAWQFGLETIKTKTTGVGIGNFAPAFFNKHHYYKASHGSYVQIGTELGYPGMFFYLGILYCCIRTLVFAKTTNIEEERVRRTLFVLLCSYIISSWMVDFGFRASYFLMAAGIAAFHRQMLIKNRPVIAREEIIDIDTQPVSFGLSKIQPLAAGPKELATVINQISISAPVKSTSNPNVPEPVEEESENGGIKWNRIGVIDFIIMLTLVWAAVKFWGYIMHHI